MHPSATNPSPCRPGLSAEAIAKLRLPGSPRDRAELIMAVAESSDLSAEDRSLVLNQLSALYRAADLLLDTLGGSRADRVCDSVVLNRTAYLAFLASAPDCWFQVMPVPDDEFVVSFRKGEVPRHLRS